MKCQLPVLVSLLAIYVSAQQPPNPCPPTGSSTIIYYRCYNQYFQCTNGAVTIKKCQNGNYYNQTSGTCVPLGTYRPPTDKCGIDPLPTCPLVGPSKIKHASCCNLYYSCPVGFGSATVQICPQGTIFNPNTSLCVTPSPSFLCATNECNIDELPTCNETYYIKYQSCSEFYQCDDYRIPYLMKCPAHLAFDKTAVACEYHTPPCP